MNRRDALKLKPGTRLLCADANKMQHTRFHWIGEVVHVTENGGILVRITEGPWQEDWSDGPGTGHDVGKQKWFPYSQVWKRS